MRTKIYLDVLFLLNFFVTFLLLEATVKLTGQPATRWRLLTGSLLGGVYSLLILFELSALLLVPIKLAMGASLVGIVFYHPRTREWRRLLKAGFCFIGANFIFAGFMTALWLFAPLQGMRYKNGVAYFNISALTLALSTIAAYGIITLFTYILNKRTRTTELAELVLGLGGRQVRVTAFMDSGNQLCDVFTGLPVILCEYGAAKELFPERVRSFFQSPGEFAFEGLEGSALNRMLRVIPVNTVAGEGTLPAFRPDSVMVDGQEHRAVVAVTMRALSDGEYRALLGSALSN